MLFTASVVNDVFGNKLIEKLVTPPFLYYRPLMVVLAIRSAVEDALCCICSVVVVGEQAGGGGLRHWRYHCAEVK